MSVENISIYLCVLNFLSSVSYSFQCSSFLLHWLNSFLGILFFLMQMFEIIFLISISGSCWTIIFNRIPLEQS